MKRPSIRAKFVDIGCHAVAELAVVTLMAALLGVAFMRERAREQA